MRLLEKSAPAGMTHRNEFGGVPTGNANEREGASRQRGVGSPLHDSTRHWRPDTFSFRSHWAMGGVGGATPYYIQYCGSSRTVGVGRPRLIHEEIHDPLSDAGGRSPVTVSGGRRRRLELLFAWVNNGARPAKAGSFSMFEGAAPERGLVAVLEGQAAESVHGGGGNLPECLMHEVAGLMGAQRILPFSELPPKAVDQEPRRGVRGLRQDSVPQPRARVCPEDVAQPAHYDLEAALKLHHPLVGEHHVRGWGGSSIVRPCRAAAQYPHVRVSVCDWRRADEVGTSLHSLVGRGLLFPNSGIRANGGPTLLRGPDIERRAA